VVGTTASLRVLSGRWRRNLRFMLNQPRRFTSGLRILAAAVSAVLVISIALIAVEVRDLFRSDAGATPSDVARTAVDIASEQEGKPYVWGAKGPSAFDASGLVTFSYGRAGLRLPDGSFRQYQALPAVEDRADVQPGDLVFSNDASCGRISAVAIVISKNEVLRASSNAGRVMRTSVNWGSVVGVGRPSPSSTTLRGAKRSSAPPGRVRPVGCEAPTRSAAPVPRVDAEAGRSASSSLAVDEGEG